MGDCKCPVCQSVAYNTYNSDNKGDFYECPVCGRYEITAGFEGLQNNPKLSSYLFYHRYKNNTYKTEYRYNTTLDEKLCDEYKTKIDDGDISNGRPVHMDEGIINNWYPKTLSERVDYILLRLNDLAAHIGSLITLDVQEVLSLFFVERQELDTAPISKTSGQLVPRSIDNCNKELQYMVSLMEEQDYIEIARGKGDTNNIQIKPKGYARVDSLNKNHLLGTNVFVAMSFKVGTESRREAIRRGISNAGYNPIFIDEVEHNNFITPEILKYIRDSKFMVVELTDQNNGAYFEEGYGMGIGKPVIQLCNKNTKLHFDIAQKNTIFWETEEEISERLKNRIKATID